MLAHGQSKTILVILAAAVLATLGGLQLLSFWLEGDLGDWDWTSLGYVLPLMFATLHFLNVMMETRSFGWHCPLLWCCRSRLRTRYKD